MLGAHNLRDFIHRGSSLSKKFRLYRHVSILLQLGNASKSPSNRTVRCNGGLWPPNPIEKNHGGQSPPLLTPATACQHPARRAGVVPIATKLNAAAFSAAWPRPLRVASVESLFPSAESLKAILH